MALTRNVLSVEGLTKTYGERLLFKDLTFGVQEGERVALVARNGSGKSTLLRAICGNEPADSGRVVFGSGVRHGHLRQELELLPDATILDTLYIGDSPAVHALRNYERVLAEGSEGDALQRACDAMDATQAWNFEARAREILGQLNLHQLDRTVGKLSGGEKRRVALAQVLLEAPDFIVLDEPTNHLDLDMISWLEQRLASMGTTILMVTHDRYFLENVCDRILELDDHTLHSYQGNFSYFLEKREERRANALAVQERARTHMKRELEWVRATPSARTTKSKSRLDRFEDIKAAAAKRLQEDPLHLTIIPERLGSKIVELHKIKRGFDGRILVEGFTHHFKRGERIGIVGRNGTGKSTLLNMILGQDMPDAGKVVVGETVVFGHYTQEGGSFNEDWKVIDAVRDIADWIPLKGGAKLTAAQLLERFLFPHAMHHQHVRLLSGGERKRLHLLRILMRNPNFLVMDEPTNDLDIFTLSVLEEFLMDFSGCLVVVSHDRYFMDKLVDHVWVLGESGQTTVRDYPGNYSQYRAQRSEEVKRAQAEAAATKVASTSPQATSIKGDYSARLSYKERLEYEGLEARIAELEKRRDGLSTQLQTELNHENMRKLGEELGAVTSDLDAAEMRWLELSERA
ncbi:MAG: ABC-F family ATP-binding cassette domain-containing protein [Bacteroidetes bacterium]|nr:ABC-F family ATP-binding cassette domain-containing protein [Bacteroidota bacterium]MDA0903654.1 ABC-F family ATP-binding cassette domain-containing protein [Bacteroidota bacterium]MDA1242592.1 ABC-F family ATP-binding cassette domain-containing protein [Bacteroidota bacterium]